MSLKQLFQDRGWPVDHEAFENTIAWLNSNRLTIALDLVDLGNITRVPGGELLQTDVRIFLQKIIEVWCSLVASVRSARSCWCPLARK